MLQIWSMSINFVIALNCFSKWRKHSYYFMGWLKNAQEKFLFERIELINLKWSFKSYSIARCYSISFDFEFFISFIKDDYFV